MLITLTFKQLSFFLSIIVLIFYLSLEHKVRMNFFQKNIELTKEIAKSIENIEIQYDKLLRNSMIIVENELLNSSNLQTESLKKLKNKLQLSTITIYDKDGFVVAITREDAPKALLDKIYKVDKFSLFSICENDKTMVGNNSEKMLPITRFRGRGIPAKTFMIWSNKINKFIRVAIDGKDIENLLKDSLSINSNLLNLNIYSPSGQLVASAKENQQEISEHLKYSEVKKIDKEKSLTIAFPFGNLKEQTCEAKKKKLTNSNDEYFYILVPEFSKESINKEIIKTRITIIFSLLSFLGIVYLYFLKKK
jgi:hypothetical protein